MLKRRDALFRSNRGDVNAVKLSALIRQHISEVCSCAEDLQAIYLAEQKNLDKKRDKPEGMEQLLSNREQIVKLTFLHVQELEMLEKQRDYQDGDSELEQKVKEKKKKKKKKKKIKKKTERKKEMERCFFLLKHHSKRRNCLN